MRSRATRLGLITIVAMVLTTIPGLAGVAPTTERISVDSDEQMQPSTVPSRGSYIWKRSISATGKIVAFESSSSFATSDDQDGDDIYVRNRKNGTTEHISVRSNGTRPDIGDSRAPEISASGRFVVFESDSPFAANDTNEDFDVYRHDRKTDKTKRISVKNNGNQVEGDSAQPSISPNGRYIAYASFATNLVRNDNNTTEDIFLYDKITKKVRRVSVRSNGNESNEYSERPSVSDDGDVAFFSLADNLVKNDDNEVEDVFVHFSSRKTKRASVSTSGQEGDDFSDQPSLSRDGTVVAFISAANNLVGGQDGDSDDIFVRLLTKKKTKLISKSSAGVGGEGRSKGFAGMLSYNGRFVAFVSEAENLVPNDTNGLPDMFWHNRQTGKTKLVSVTHDGSPLDLEIYEGSISGDGKWVAFDTDATNIDDRTDPVDQDVFIRGPMR